MYRTISIVIPCFNEERTLEQVLKSVLAANTLNLKKEVIIVDDCSRDNTPEILAKYKSKKTIKVCTQPKNQGKGAALKTGFLQTTGDIVLIQDADLEYSPDDYPHLLSPFLVSQADVVYGSRLMSGAPRRVIYFWHWLGNSFLTFLSNLCTNLNLTDMETGYKVFRGDLIRQIAPALACQRFGFEPEVTAKIAKIKGLRIYEVGISYFGRTYEEGKKINWKDGFKAIFAILKFNFLTSGKIN